MKLTNTLPCRNRGGALPEAEATRYLSGRALHPLAVAAAARLQEACGGELDISFAGGADAVNTPDLLRCGLRPVTVCSDLLRPGGYLRLRQYLENVGTAMTAAGARDLDGLITGGRPLAAAPPPPWPTCRATPRPPPATPATGATSTPTVRSAPPGR